VLMGENGGRCSKFEGAAAGPRGLWDRRGKLLVVPAEWSREGNWGKWPAGEGAMARCQPNKMGDERARVLATKALSSCSGPRCRSNGNGAPLESFIQALMSSPGRNICRRRAR
jgi:hypothetical protein